MGHEMTVDRCGSHEMIDKAIIRQEEILEAFRKENVAHQLYVASALSKICTRMDEITEIKATQVANADRREKFVSFCEAKRNEIEGRIDKVEERLSEGKGFVLGISALGGLVGAGIMVIINWFSK
jgi:VIT1/CCC1 family predicted Fe2+/Mn2+ transporter